MKNKKMAISIALGLVLGLSAIPARAEMRAAELRVNGMSCPFCTFGIEKKLRHVSGVNEVEVFLDEGQIRLVLSAENTATVQDIESAVDDAGFQLSGLSVDVEGTLVEDDGAMVLQAGAASRYRLVERNAGSVQRLSPEAKRRVRTKAAGGKVLVSGEVHSHGDDPPALLVERVEPVKEGGT